MPLISHVGWVLVIRHRDQRHSRTPTMMSVRCSAGICQRMRSSQQMGFQCGIMASSIQTHPPVVDGGMYNGDMALFTHGVGFQWRAVLAGHTISKLSLVDI